LLFRHLALIIRLLILLSRPTLPSPTMRLLAHSIGQWLGQSLALGGVLALAACDTTPRGRDAAAGQKTAEVAIRFELVGDAAPSVAMLAYRAQSSGIGTDEVLNIVDPLTAPAPEGRCAFRDVAGSARALGALGGRVELEALPGWHLELGGNRGSIAPTPRVYPDVASVVGGVVAEFGPVNLEHADGFLDDAAVLTLVDAAGDRQNLLTPARPHLVGPEGGVIPANSVLPATGDLIFGLTGSPATFLELRPFGATWALSCPISPAGQDGHDRVVVRASEVAALSSLRVPVSVEAVSRASHPVTLGGTTVRLTVEVRSSTVVELRP
jgi:hypothetical protein